MEPDVSDFDCRIGLLGGFALRLNNLKVRMSADADRLIAFLALRHENVPRSVAAGSLWAECGETRAFGNLRSALWRIRRVSDLVIESDNRVLAIATSVRVDLWDAEAAAHDLETRNDGRELPPLDLFTRDLLPGWYDEWITLERERHRQLALHALEQLAARFLEREKYHAAIQAALAAVAQDPLRESSHRQLISIHLLEGNYSEARRQYEEYRRLLRDELSIGPSPMLQRLMREASSGEVAVANSPET